MFNGISFVKIFRRAKGSLAANGGHLLQTDKTHPRKTTNNSTLSLIDSSIFQLKHSALTGIGYFLLRQEITLVLV